MYNRAPWHKELLSEQNTKFILKESPCVITCILYNVESTCDLSENYSRPKLNPKQAPTKSPFTVFIWNLNQKTAMCDTIIIVEVSAYQISSHPEDHSYYHRQDHKWPPFKHMAPTWTESHHGCIRELHLTSMQCTQCYWMIRCTRCSSFKIVCESLQTTQSRSFKRYWERGSNLASIERVSLYEQVKKSPWVLSLALFSGKMVPRAGQPNTRSTSHNGTAPQTPDEWTLRCLQLIPDHSNHSYRLGCVCVFH